MSEYRLSSWEKVGNQDENASVGFSGYTFHGKYGGMGGEVKIDCKL